MPAKRDRGRVLEGMFGGAVESFAVSDVILIAVYRVSEACQLTHGAFSAGDGRFARVVVRVTPGWAKDTDATTVEDAHGHLDDICDGADLKIRRSLSRRNRHFLAVLMGSRQAADRSPFARKRARV